MSREGVNKLVSRITSVIETCRNDCELSYAECIGALDIAKQEIHQEMREDENQESPDT